VSDNFSIWITMLPTRHPYLNKKKSVGPKIRSEFFYSQKSKLYFRGGYIIPFVTFSSVIHSVYTVYTFCCKQHKKKYPIFEKAKEINSGIYILTRWYCESPRKKIKLCRKKTTISGKRLGFTFQNLIYGFAQVYIFFKAKFFFVIKLI